MKVTISPRGSMSLLSQLEIDRLQESSDEQLYRLFRNCCLAVLNMRQYHRQQRRDFRKIQRFRCKRYQVRTWCAA